MARKVTSGAKNAPAVLFNWLADFDTRTKKLPRATTWWDYSHFIFARFPSLQPHPESPVKALKESFRRELARWEEQIAGHTTARVTLDKLSPDLRRQLAALLSDTIEDLERFTNRRKKKEWFGKIASDGQAWSRILRSKHRDACLALQNLVSYCKKRDDYLSSDLRQKAEQSLLTLQQVKPLGIPTAPFAKSIRDEVAALTEDPSTGRMVQTYWFFRAGCGLNGDESEVRTALIRNAFWTHYGVSKVVYRDVYRAGDSRGCEAVRKAITRFRARQRDTRNRKT